MKWYSKRHDDSLMASNPAFLGTGLTSGHQLLDAFQQVRQTTNKMAEGLSPEDQNLQSMPGASPMKWHRAHTTWFFETFVLKPHVDRWGFAYRPIDEQFAYLFNSYYNGVGAQFPRAHRGLMSRPDCQEVDAYRQHVDDAMVDLLERVPEAELKPLQELVVLGLNHEQQHQELMVTDLKHAFSFNPIAPAWTRRPDPMGPAAEQSWTKMTGGLVQIGHDGDDHSKPLAFHFDNETPSHTVYLEDFALARRPVTCGEYLEFMRDDGYKNVNLWLSDGWAWRRDNEIEAPLYWKNEDGAWFLQTLGCWREVDPEEPICHISFYEAHAFALWAGARLPTEAEWETAARTLPDGSEVNGHFASTYRYHPASRPDDKTKAQEPLVQMFGDVWEWTASSYAPYPGFKAVKGAIGEYNGKFMANQMVLRGGSCATPENHIRVSYRNFFYPPDRWQFSGLRLARDL